MARLVSARLALVLALTLCGCSAHRAANVPLASWDPRQGYFDIPHLHDGRSDQLLLLAAFSGGGTRSAAFSYGALEELAATPIALGGPGRRVLDEVDIVSGVSGGSFTAAYYALYGERIFQDFEERFLTRNVERALLLRLFLPWNLAHVFSSTYGRSEIAAAYYDQHLFDGATFADVTRADAPALFINSTDISSGDRFSFSPEFFDLICSDLGAFPLGHAVAASSAVPGLLSPVTLRNYAGTCGYVPPPWLAGAVQHPRQDPRRAARARGLMSYLDRTRRPYVHVVDGGVADNLGVRPLYETVLVEHDPRTVFRALSGPDLRTIVLIVVNAEVQPRRHWDLSEGAPALLEMLLAISGFEINRVSLDTIDLLRESFREWATDLSTPDRPVRFHLVEVSFEAVADDAERAYLNSLPTNFHISAEQVEHLRAAARRVLHDSSAFQDALADIATAAQGAPPPRSASTTRPTM